MELREHGGRRGWGRAHGGGRRGRGLVKKKKASCARKRVRKWSQPQNFILSFQGARAQRKLLPHTSHTRTHVQGRPSPPSVTMPPRIATPGAAPTLGDQYRAIPPMTRALATGVVALTLADKLGLVRASSLVLYWPLVLKRLQVRGRARGRVGASARAHEKETRRCPILKRCPIPPQPLLVSSPSIPPSLPSSGASPRPSCTWARSPSTGCSTWCGCTLN